MLAYNVVFNMRLPSGTSIANNTVVSWGRLNDLQAATEQYLNKTLGCFKTKQKQFLRD